MSIYCFDIDGTICVTDGKDYANAKPIPWMVEAIKRLHLQGHEVRYYTARGWVSQAEQPWIGSPIWKLTMRQLNEWGLTFGEVYQKPNADVYVDDLMRHPGSFYSDDEGGSDD